MSRLSDIFMQLSHGAVGAVQNGNILSYLAEYLNVKRPIENALEEKMQIIQEHGGGLVLLIGNAGDGKSHIISQLKASGRFNDFEFYNDATASCSPKMSSMETLEFALRDFKDDTIESTHSKMLLAINLGKLHDFIEKPQFSRIGKLAESVLNDKYDEEIESNYLCYVSFSTLQAFELDVNSQEEYPIDSSFVRAILDKITEKSFENPFYVAYNDTKELCGSNYPEVINFELLMLPKIKDTLVKLIVECILRYQLIFTPRDFFDFISSIMIHPNIANYKEQRDFFEALLPSLIYSSSNSKIQRVINQIDPLRISSSRHNNDLAVLFTSFKLREGFLPKEVLGNVYDIIVEKINFFYKNHGKDTERISKFVFRLIHLINYHSESDFYKAFLDILKRYYYNEDTRKQVLLELEELVDLCIPRHYGSYAQVNDLVPLNIQGSKYRLFARIDKVMEEVKMPYLGDNKNNFMVYIPLKWVVSDHEIPLKMDYKLFEYLNVLNKGKLTITYESELNIEFSRFINELIKCSTSDKEVVIMSSDDNTYTLRSKLNNIISLS